ncbi:PQQ-binding-like beta-propeller repeat protein, partial [Candidatus Bathyarchaeota archaeon]|nr:PQQ-binding-like beta-propeller repeat protein [Candidatus Bathyarchaeota archaeon]
SPAVVGDMVYIGSNDKKVYCLDAETGAKNWEYTTGGTIESSPAVADGKVYIGSFDGKVYSFKSAPLSFQFGARLGVEVVEGVSISVDGTWQSTQFSVDLEPGWHRFAADGAIKIESTVYQFSHWENQEGTNINTNRVYWKNIQETSSLYTVYTPRTSTISLTILDISELPLFEVTVTLDGEPVGLSDINGELTVPGVPDGVHVLNVELEGYQSRCKWVWVVRDRTVSLTLLDNPVVHIEAALNENPIECGVRVDDVWYSNPVDLSLSAGWHRFTPTTRKWVGGEVYSFLHWTDDEGNVLSTRLWYWRKIVADETIVAIYE